MNLQQANGLLSLIDAGQTAINYANASLQRDQAELQARWVQIDNILAESALNEQYLQDSAMYEAQLSAMGHTPRGMTANYASGKQAGLARLERDKRLLRLRAEAQAAQAGFITAQNRFVAGANTVVGSVANIRDDLNRKAALENLTYENYFKGRKEKTKTRLEDK